MRNIFEIYCFDVPTQIVTWGAQDVDKILKANIRPWKSQVQLRSSNWLKVGQHGAKESSCVFIGQNVYVIFLKKLCLHCIYS